MEHHDIIFNNRLSRARRIVESGTQIPSFAEDHEPETRHIQKHRHYVCDPSQSHQTGTFSHPQQPGGLGGQKPKREEMRGHETLDPRKGGKLEDTMVTTLHERLVRCHERTK